jgi:hypothetical protein
MRSALGLRLRSPWPAYRLGGRWRDRSTLTVRNELRCAVGLSVVTTVTGERPAGRSAPPSAGEVARRTVAQSKGLVSRTVADPAVRLEPRRARGSTSPGPLVTVQARPSVRTAPRPSLAADTRPVMVTSPPPRVLARTSRSQPSAPVPSAPHGRARELVAQRGAVVPADHRPPDIERLTESVMAAIDRRLWSHSERMGRR